MKKRTLDYNHCDKITAVYCTGSRVCSIGNKTGTVWHIHLFRCKGDIKKSYRTGGQNWLHTLPQRISRSKFMWSPWGRIGRCTPGSSKASGPHQPGERRENQNCILTRMFLRFVTSMRDMQYRGVGSYQWRKSIARLPPGFGRILLILLNVNTDSSTNWTSSRKAEHLQ